jgi:DNA-binding NtrC family response regulator
VILAGEGTIQMAHLPPGFSGTPASSGTVSSDQDQGDLHIRVGQTIEQAERALIEVTLEHTKNNKTRAAEILGISQKTLFNKLKEYGTQGAGA